MNFFDPFINSAGSEFSRRDFIRRAGGCGALTSTSILATLLQLRMTGKVMAAPTLGPFNDYKALICVFLFGGNDSFQMLAPYENAEHAKYVSRRGGLVPPAQGGVSGGLAWPKSDSNTSLNLLPITAANGPNAGRQFGILPAMPNLQSLYNDGRAAFVANTGTLIRPTSRSDYNAKIALPKGLFSHSDEVRNWQTSVPQSRTEAKGWAGRIADLLTDPASKPSISMSIALEKLNIVQTGENVVPYVIDDSNGARRLDSYPSTSNRYNRIRNGAIDGLFPKDDGSLAGKYGDLLQRTHAKNNRDAIEAAIAYNAATGSVNLTTQFPDTNIGRQAEQVARAIAARETLGHDRQIFFISRGSFDHHNDLVNFYGNGIPADDSQYHHLEEVDAAVAALQDALEEIETTPGELTNNVVTFSASDFGRTLTSNGNGSDHAWGGNQFVISGANTLNSTVWGEYPTDLSDPQHVTFGALDTQRGRLIPTTSVDEYAAELSMWFGVPDDSNLEMVFPNIRNFHSPGGMPIGFLNGGAQATSQRVLRGSRLRDRKGSARARRRRRS